MKTSRPGKMTLLTGLLTLLTAGASFAQQMNYQGRLTDGAGAPVADAQYPITFDIFDSATGTNKKWGPQVVPADTVQGRFNVILGPTDASGSNIVSAFDGGTRYLQITFQGNALLPRQQILNAPSAFFAETAGRLASVHVHNGRVGVGLEGANINSKLHVNGDGTIPSLRVQVGGSSKLTVAANGGTAIGGFDDTPPANGLHVIGTVGIGTISPDALSKLHVHGGRLRVSNPSGAVLELANGPDAPADINYVFTDADGNLRLSTDTAKPIVMQLQHAGNVAIGTPIATQGKLVVSGFAQDPVTQQPRIYDASSIGFQHPSPQNFNDISIYASHAIHAATLRAYSDARIKLIAGRSDSATDLATLRRVEITDYRYKDVIGKGNRPQKKVVAQQLEKIYPQAVTQSTDVVPDIYQKATLQNGWVQLVTDLKQGERVQLISATQSEIHEVLEVAPGRFRIDFKPGSEKVFVFGREVKDFRNVDYQAIAMLNVSATQELARQVEALKKSEARVAQLEREMSELRKLVTHLVATGKTPEQTAQTRSEETPLMAVRLRRDNRDNKAGVR